MKDKIIIKTDIGSELTQYWFASKQFAHQG